MSQITAQIQYEKGFTEVNSSLEKNPLDNLDEILDLQELEDLDFKLEKNVDLFFRFIRDLSSIKNIRNIFHHKLSETFNENNIDEFLYGEDILIDDFVFIPAKKTITRKIKIKSIRKAKPIVFDE